MDADGLELRLQSPKDHAVDGLWRGRGAWLVHDVRNGMALVHVVHEEGPNRFINGLMVQSDELNLSNGTSQPGGPVTVQLHRPAGVIQLEGTRVDRHGSSHPEARGQFRIILDSKFLQETADLLKTELPPGLSGDLVLSGITADYIRQMTAGGWKLEWREALDLWRAGVKPEMAQALRNPRPVTPAQPASNPQTTPDSAAAKAAQAPQPVVFTIQDMINLQRRSVPISYVDALRDAGCHFTADDLIQLHVRGVTSSYITELYRTGGGRFTTEDYVMLHVRGVSTSYITGMKAAGYAFTPNDLVNVHVRGVTTSYAERMKAAGGQWDANDLINMSIRGVTPDYAQNLKNAGYVLSSSDLINLSVRGVPVDYAKAVAEAMPNPPTANDLLQLWVQQVKPELIKALQRK